MILEHACVDIPRCKRLLRVLVSSLKGFNHVFDLESLDSLDILDVSDFTKCSEID